MSRYVIVGAGAVGVTLAAQLREAGREVLLVARGEQLDALRAGKLRYSRPEGTRHLSLPVADAAEAGAGLTDGDLLVLATKTQDAEPVLAEWAWRPVRQADGTWRSAAASLPVITLQNGLEAERAALRRFAVVFGSVLWVAAGYVGADEVVAPSAPVVGTAWIGAYPGGSHPLLAAVAADLEAGGFRARVVSDIRRWKAAKLLSSVTFALSALYQPGPLRGRAEQLLRAEAREILTASGQDIADITAGGSPIAGRPSVRTGAVWQRYGGNSTWQSLTRSGTVETDFLNGEIVLAARLLGRTAPANEAILERVHQARREGTPAGSLGADDLLAVLPQLSRGVVTDATGAESAAR